MKIYLASPFGFSEASRAFYYGTMVPELERAGFTVLDPWMLTDPEQVERVRRMRYGVERQEAFRKLDVEIGRVNAEAIDEADAVLAVLDGVDVDSGTAAEIGYAFGKGKKIVAYRGDFRICSDNEGTIVNLQVEYFIRASGGQIVTAWADVVEAMKAL